MDTEIKIKGILKGSRKENIVAPPVIPETMAIKGTIQQRRETKAASTATPNELLIFSIRKK